MGTCGKSSQRALSLLLTLAVISSSLAPVIVLAVDTAPPTLPNTQLFTSQSIPRVDQTTGALVQRVPLDIPPGRNGLTPDLALVYNSQDLTDGIVGYGWSLSIPYIERLNKTGTERLYTDNYFTSSWGGELATTTATSSLPMSGIAASSTLSNALVSYYKLDESSGVAYDATSTNHLTNNNAATFVSGKINNGADLELSSTQSFSITDGSQSGFDITSDFSVSAWVKFETITDMQLVSKYNPSGNQRAYHLYFQNEGGGALTLRFENSENGITSSDHGSSSFSPSTGTWYHLVASFNAASHTTTFYKDGVAIGSDSSGTRTSIYNSSASFLIGGRADVGGTFDGVIDEVGIFSRPLTQGDVNALYNSGSGFAYSTGGAAASSNDYRHRIEDGRFLKYIFDSNTWTAYDKNGTRYRFGYTSQAQQFPTTTSTMISRWMLEEVRDTNDNFIRYVYGKNNNQIYPSQILYTGSGSTDGIFTIDIATSTRPDVLTSYRNAYKVTTNSRITEIKASVNGSWVRKYTLSYGAGVNGVRSLLSSVQKTGRDDAATELALPALTFAYSTSTPAYTYNANPRSYGSVNVMADIDGNGLPDMSTFYQNSTGLSTYRMIDKNAYPYFTHTNDNVSTDYWAIESSAMGGYSALERGVRFFDATGDGTADIVRSMRNPDGSFTRTLYRRTGDLIWTSTPIGSSTIPMFAYGVSSDVAYSSGLFGNMNGDGLPDYIISLPALSAPVDANGTYLHSATTTDWTLSTSTFTPPATFPTSGTSNEANGLVDINGDGLDDWMESGAGFSFRLNTGTGWTSPISPWNVATSTRHSNGWDRGIRFIDVNGDGLPDYVHAYTMPNYSSNSVPHIEKGTYNYIYLNTGNGWATSTLQMPQYIFNGVLSGSTWSGLIDFNESVDWNGDSIPDQSVSISTTGKSDLLKQITYPTSGSTDVEYQFSSQLGTNPNLALPVLVVTKVTNRDNRGNTDTTTYMYDGGKIYTSGDIRDRKFAGFETISEYKGGTRTTSYYHQGATASTTAGERTDDFSLIGKMYRKDVMASSTGALLNRTFHNWNSLYQGNSGRYFVSLASTTEQTFDGDSTHTDKAMTYIYSTSTGNLLSATDWGEVLGNSDGTFTDTGSDMATTTTLYAASSSVNMQVPYAASTTNQAGTKINETRNYYDGLALGSVTAGNRTKQESWMSGSTYASTTKTYNSYGLPTEEKDPLGNATTYAYDPYNLFVATSTNALSQATGYLYDYASGKARQTLDPNTRRTQTLFDPVGRVKEVKQPDLTTPTTLVTKTAYTYNDTWPVYVKQTDYLNAATSTDTYQYTDGLGRTHQTRKSAEDGNVAIQDFTYTSRGLLASSSLPYFGTGASSTAATSTSALFTSYFYDPLDRVSAVTNVVGTTANTYDDWHTIVTDPRGKRKDFYKDARDNLSRVVEHSGSEHATTTYTYNLNKQLLSITDASSNVRNFTYDGLGRRLTAQDIHASGDGTYGTFTYAYDAANNLTQRVDPKSQTVNFTYDALNRPLTEDHTGGSGTEVEYAYDSGTDGIGRLSAATTSDSVSNYTYNPLGNISREVKTLGGTRYQTDFTYDRLGNQASITYPDASQVLYTYNTGGLLEKVDRQPSGGAIANVIADYDYAPNGQLTYAEFTNGVKTYKTYDPNALYRLTNLRTDLATSSAQLLAYLYDANGNITRIADTASSTANSVINYVYDDLNRLLSATSSTVSGASASGISASSTLSNGLVSYWKFDESSGAAYDSTVNHNDLTNNNSISYASAIINNGADLEDASSQYFSITDASQSGLDLTGSATWAFWFKPESINDYDKWISKWENTGNQRSYELYLSPDGGAQWSIELSWDTDGTVGGNTVHRSNNLSWTNGTWYHVCVSFNAPTHTTSFYRNGASVSTASNGTATSIHNGTAPFAMGARPTTGDLDGIMDETGIWSRALSGAECSALYNAGSGLAYGSGQNNATSTQSFSYDLLGNITNKTDAGAYTYAGTSYANPHAVTQIGTGLATTTYAYDNNGNLTSVGAKLFSWNYRDRLTQVATGTATTTYAYDNQNQRVRQTVLGTGTTTYAGKYFDRSATSTQATTTSYIWSGDTLVATVIGNGTATSTYFSHPDHLGSTNILTNASGTIQQTLEYYPYGSERINSGSDTSSRTFIGQYKDDIADLNYLQARFYQGDKGRFISQDPVFWHTGTTLQNRGASNSTSGSNWSQNTPSSYRSTSGMGRNGGISQEQMAWLSDPQAQNSYGYARNNPIRFKDPEGLWYKEFITGQQSWSSFQGEVGEVANYLGQSSPAWNFAMNHPYTTGAIVGVASAGAAQAGLYGTVALKAAAYPGVGLSYSASRVVEGTAYLYLAQDSLRGISSTLTQFSNYNLNNPTFGSSAKLTYNMGLQGASTFGGERVGGIADTLNLLSSALRDLSKALSSISSGKSKK